MHVLRTIVIAFAFSQVAASSTSESVFTLTFEKPVEDMSKLKDMVQHSATLAAHSGEFLSTQVLVLDTNHLEVSYIQGRPGCAAKPEVDDAISAMKTTVKSLEAEYGPVHRDQHHRANGGDWQN